MSLHLVDDDTLNDALSSCIDTWADMFDSVISNGILLIPDGAVSNVVGGGEGGEGGGNRASVEHPEPRTRPGMEPAPPHSHAVQDAGEISSDLSDLCSGQAEIRGSADSTAAETMQGETPVDMQVDDAAQVQELAPIEDAPLAADISERVATVPPHVVSAADHTGTIMGPASPTSGLSSSGLSSEVEVSNATGLAEIPVQQDDGAKVNELVDKDMDEEMHDKGYDKGMKNVNDSDNANKKGAINTNDNADNNETADSKNTRDKNNAKEKTEEEASEEASQEANKEADEDNDSTPAT